MSDIFKQSLLISMALLADPAISGSLDYLNTQRTEFQEPTSAFDSHDKQLVEYPKRDQDPKWGTENFYEIPSIAENRNKGADPRLRDFKDPQDDAAKKAKEIILKNLSYVKNATNTVIEMDPTTGWPRNPAGPTGISGRGFYYRMGPNFAADPLVMIKVWQDKQGRMLISPTHQQKDQLEESYRLVAIHRKDAERKLALPGGMVEPGDNFNKTKQKEFTEECLGKLERQSETAQDIQKHLNEIFAKGHTLYEGRVAGEQRETDHAWAHTQADVFIIDDPEVSQLIVENLSAGDDAIKTVLIEKSASEYGHLWHIEAHRLFAAEAFAYVEKIEKEGNIR